MLVLALFIFTGFVIPVDYMLGWCRWINYLDPVAYGFESLMINELHNHNFTCASFVPAPSVSGYENVALDNMACNAVGAVPGQTWVNGDAYIRNAYKYVHSHKWRNIGILIVFFLGLHTLYFVATEFISAKKSKGEIIVFRRGQAQPTARPNAKDIDLAASGPLAVVDKIDASSSSNAGVIQGSTSVFHWSNVCYDVKIKNQPRGILDHVDGWVKPGTLTALMVRLPIS
jgi:ATP-binding cassette, subfamily G (WHITE), member 2, PDR